MPRLIAFLRAINVGGHTVTMDRLRLIFESLGFSNVETFIASGNVVFETRSKNIKALEKKIEQSLNEELGYQVATFVRTESELAAVASYKPFPQSALDEAGSLNIAFLSAPLDDESIRKLMAMKTAIDEFHVNDREVYWLCRNAQSGSTFSNSVFEKITGAKATFRGVNTVRRMAAKYASRRL